MIAENYRLVNDAAMLGGVADELVVRQYTSTLESEPPEPRP
jgi:hypothetical protein